MAPASPLKLTILALALALTTTLPVLRAQAQVFCAQGILTTKAYDCALTLAPDGSCPVNSAAGYSYWPATITGPTTTVTGCCAATATPRSVGDGIACCACEAACTGYLPRVCGWSTGADGMYSALSLLYGVAGGCERRSWLRKLGRRCR
jgi:hypothetical protein